MAPLGRVTVSVTGTMRARSSVSRPTMPVSSSQTSRPTSLTGAPMRNDPIRLGMTTLATPVISGKSASPVAYMAWPKANTRSPTTSVMVPMVVMSMSPRSMGTARGAPGSSLAATGRSCSAPPAAIGTMPYGASRADSRSIARSGMPLVMTGVRMGCMR